MPFTSKLIAEYSELINERLDSIPVNHLEDFDLIIRLLSQVIEETFIKVENPTEQQISVLAIDSLLKSPELYVQHEADYNAFKDIVRSRIQGKISEFQSLDREQQSLYIREQQLQKVKNLESQAEMSNFVPPRPGDANHVPIPSFQHVCVEYSIPNEINNIRVFPRPQSETEAMVEVTDIDSINLRSPTMRSAVTQLLSLGAMTLRDYLRISKLLTA